MCEISAEEFGEDTFEFNLPASSKEIEQWEKENGINIPTTYKDWLEFSNGSTIRSNLAIFYSLNEFIIDNEKKPYCVPDECIVIGELGGWGKVLCFSTIDGSLITYDHEDKRYISDFNSILKWVIHGLE